MGRKVQYTNKRMDTRGTIQGGSRGPLVRMVKIRRAKPGETGNTIMSDEGQGHTRAGGILEE